MSNRKSKKEITKEKRNVDLALMDKVNRLFSADLDFNCVMMDDRTYLFSDRLEIKDLFTRLGPVDSDSFMEYATTRANLLQTQRRLLEDLKSIKKTKSDEEHCSDYDQIKDFIFAE